MLHMKNILIIIILFIIFQSAIGQEQNVQFDVQLLKSKYMFMEPILLDVTVKNITSNEVRVKSFCVECQNGSLKIDLFNSDGNPIEYTGPIVCTAGGTKFNILLESKESNIRNFNLLNFFSNHDYGLFGAIFMTYLPADNYTASIIFSETESKKIEFEVVEPTGKYKIEFDEMIIAYLEKRETESNDVFLEFISKYPNSVYLEKVLKDSNRYSELINKFPNSGFCGNILKSLVRQLPLDERQGFLQKIILKNPDSRSAKIAKKIIKDQKLEKVKQ